MQPPPQQYTYSRRDTDAPRRRFSCTSRAIVVTGSRAVKSTTWDCAKFRKRKRPHAQCRAMTSERTGISYRFCVLFRTRPSGARSANRAAGTIRKEARHRTATHECRRLRDPGDDPHRFDGRWCGLAAERHRRSSGDSSELHGENPPKPGASAAAQVVSRGPRRFRPCEARLEDHAARRRRGDRRASFLDQLHAGSWRLPEVGRLPGDRGLARGPAQDGGGPSGHVDREPALGAEAQLARGQGARRPRRPPQIDPPSRTTRSSPPS